MALTKTSVTLIAPTPSIAGGGSKTSPNVASPAIDCRSYYGGEVTYKLTNGATGPTITCTVTIQTSHDGVNWYDYWNASGDFTANSVNSQSIALDRGVMYLRLIAYGNTVQNVTVEAYLQAVTGV